MDLRSLNSKKNKEKQDEGENDDYCEIESHE